MGDHILYIEVHHHVDVSPAYIILYEDKSQVGLDETRTDVANFSKIVININILEIQFGYAFSISDSAKAIFWT